MNIESLVPDKLKTIVIEAVGDDYSLYEFLGEVNYAIVSAIGDGNIFDDYLSNRSFVEDEFEIEYYLPEDWEASVKNACEKKGIDYEKETSELTENNKKIAFELKKAIENKEIVVETTMTEIISRACNENK